MLYLLSLACLCCTFYYCAIHITQDCIVFKFVECSDGENCSKSSWKRNYRLMRRSVSANHQTSLGHPFIPVVVFCSVIYWVAGRCWKVAVMVKVWAQCLLWYYRTQYMLCSVKVKVKVHTLDIAPLHSESPLQKRSGVVRVLKGFHSFTCTMHTAIGMNHTCLCLPSYNRYSFTDPGGMEGWVDLGVYVAQAEIRTCNLPIANPTLYHTATSAPYSLGTGSWLASADATAVN